MQYIFYIIMIFFIYSIVGWFMESTIASIDTKKIQNRGMLFGPWCPIYGIGAVSITIFDKIIHLNYIYVFLICAIGASIIEYFIGYVLEKIFKLRWWDYSHFKYNINGRICLYSAFLFGIFGLVILFLNSYINDTIFSLPLIILYIITLIMSLVFIIDISVTTYILKHLDINKDILQKDSTEEIKKAIKSKRKKRKK